MHNLLIHGVSAEQSWDVAERARSEYSVIVADDEVQYDFPDDIQVLEGEGQLDFLPELSGCIVFFGVSDEPGSVSRSLYVEEYMAKLQFLTERLSSVLLPGSSVVFVALSLHGPPNNLEATLFFELLENLDAEGVRKHFLAGHSGINWREVKKHPLSDLSDEVLASLE